MNRIVIANGESDADGASGLDAASRVHEIAIPAIVACGELDAEACAAPPRSRVNQPSRAGAARPWHDRAVGEIAYAGEAGRLLSSVQR